MTDRRECKHKHYKSQDRQMTDRRECKHNNTNSRQHWHNNFMNSLRHTYKLDTTHQLIIHTHLSTCLQALNTSKTVHSSFFPRNSTDVLLTNLQRRPRSLLVLRFPAITTSCSSLSVHYGTTSDHVLYCLPEIDKTSRLQLMYSAQDPASMKLSSQATLLHNMTQAFPLLVPGTVEITLVDKRNMGLDVHRNH